MSMRFMPISIARLSKALASAGSSGSPQNPGPVMRIAPKPIRFTSRSPPTASCADFDPFNNPVECEKHNHEPKVLT